MKLKLDTSKEYAIALEGGGAKGAYEIGVWKALEENGVKYCAVAGSSVGALNGALMAMGDLEQAINLWENITFSDVMNVDDAQMRKLYRGDFLEVEWKDFLKDCVDAVKEGGLDIAPLRKLLEEQVDGEKIHRSPVKLFLVTYSLTDKKELDLDADTLDPETLRNMLLASAYLPIFQRKRLEGKQFLDGGVQNLVPVDCLLKRGYRDIIVIRIYGIGFEKRVTIPEDANMITVAPKEKLGGILQFEPEQSKKDMQRGYFDGLKMLYGLAGETYYIDRQWDETQAYFAIKTLIEEKYGQKKPSLRELNEKILPKLAKKLKVKEGGYYEILIAFLEDMAQQLGITPFAVMTEEELLQKIGQTTGENRDI